MSHPSAPQDVACPFCSRPVNVEMTLYGGRCPHCFGEIPGEESPTDPGEEKKQAAAVVKAQKKKAEAEKKALDEERKPGPRDFKVLKYSSRGGQRPQVKTVRVLGNERLTSGGQIKRAKPKQTSVKKKQLG